MLSTERSTSKTNAKLWLLHTDVFDTIGTILNSRQKIKSIVPLFVHPKRINDSVGWKIQQVECETCYHFVSTILNATNSTLRYRFIVMPHTFRCIKRMN